jgi:hypothetical protein
MYIKLSAEQKTTIVSAQLLGMYMYIYVCIYMNVYIDVYIYMYTYVHKIKR